MESIQGNIELTIIKGKATTTSRQIAYYFNKRHDNVLQGIENLDCSPQFNRLNFQVVEYKDEKGETRKEYQITRDGFMYVAMGFTGKRAAQFKEAYIQAFNEMEYKLYRQSQTALQQESPMLNDLFSIGNNLENTLVNVTHTQRGEIIGISKLEQQADPVISKEKSTTLHKPSWQLIVEIFFDEINSDTIPEEMRQNMLISKVLMTLAKGEKKQHDCLFFRPSNLMAFFHKEPRFYDLINASLITKSKTLLDELNKAGVLAFNGKMKEKGIPIKPDMPLETRRVPHLVALDLVVLEKDYGIVMASNGNIAKALK